MNDDQFVLEPAAFLDLWKDKLFIGQEFLTWLWIYSEIHGNFLSTKAGEVELWFESRLHLESGEGGDRKSVTCQMHASGRLEASYDWAEALTALKRAKKLTRARLKVSTEDKEWSFSLAAGTLTPQGVKFPKTFAASEEEEDTDSGRFLERVALLKELTAIVEALFKQFLEIRLSPDWELTELPRLNKWLTER
ncbi:MAG: hypothetical protein LBV79_04320 [Candidatus Adiutrix sp.]|jgi:hypothetical protein|nr:hypothetical protein [Candidatus Adiutrix sp.]